MINNLRVIKEVIVFTEKLEQDVFVYYENSDKKDLLGKGKAKIKSSKPRSRKQTTQ